MKSFTPTAATTNVTITGTTQALAITKPATGASGVVRLVSTDTSVCFIALGDSTITTAATSGHPIRPNSEQDIDVGPNVTHIAVIGTANTLKLYATFGQAR